MHDEKVRIPGEIGKARVPGCLITAKDEYLFRSDYAQGDRGNNAMRYVSGINLKPGVGKVIEAQGTGGLLIDLCRLEPDQPVGAVLVA